MDLTRSFIDEMHALMKAYDIEKDIIKRSELGFKLDLMSFKLSDGQIRQVSTSYRF